MANIRWGDKSMGADESDDTLVRLQDNAFHAIKVFSMIRNISQANTSLRICEPIAMTKYWFQDQVE